MEAWRVEKHFWADVDQRGPDECWPWCGAAAHRYGKVQLRGDTRSRSAHRVAYELGIGPIPGGRHVHHLCRNTLCCNPAHLQVIDPDEHRKIHHPPPTHCPHGHPYEGDNLCVWTNPKTGGTVRSCRTCNNERDRKRNATRKRKDKLAAMARKRKQDPEYAARKREYQRRWAAKKRASDPEFRERERKAASEYNRRKRAVSPPS